MSERYRPSNGTEGDCFHSAWCNNCQRDALLNGTKTIEDDLGDDELCEIVCKAMNHNVDHPDYPAEWTHDENGSPCCTAFVPISDPISQRCTQTEDMFGD